MMIPAGRVDWACILGSRLSADDNATEFEDEYCSILKSGSMSPAMEMDWIESWSLNETLDRRLSLVVMTTETETSPLFLT
jgi:hypothetical protein